MNDAPPIEIVSFRPGTPRAYRVAGTRVVTDFAMPAYRTFELQAPAAWSAEWDAPAADGGERAYDGWGLIADRQRRVVCHASATGIRLAVEGIATYWISPDGGRIAEVEVDTQAAPDTRAVAALGAPLILALARRGTFCIHASAATFDDKLVAFIGESGAGKSTLARFLDAEGGARWRRIIDDTLPLAPIGADIAQALPHFPQLKMPDALQPSRLVPERMPLRAIYVLGSGSEVNAAPIRPGVATLALAGNTVAGRLFGRSLLGRHLNYCADLATRLSVRHLSYPRELDRLPAVRDALAADLMSQS